MSFRVSHPADTRSDRLNSHEEDGSKSVSNFNACYKVKQVSDSSDEEGPDRQEEYYSVNFENRGKATQNRKMSHSRFGKSKTGLYDMLTDRSKATLETLEVNLLDKLERGENLPEITTVYNELRLMTSEPQMEFDDFDYLKNYTMGVTRYGMGSSVLSSTNHPVVIYNNLTNLVILTVDHTTKNYTLKSLYTPKAEEILVYLGFGSGNLEDCVITAEAKSQNLVFIDIATENVLFKIPLELENPDLQISMITTINHQHVVVIMEDWTIYVIEIENANMINKFKLAESNTKDFGILQNSFAIDKEVLLCLSNGLVLLNPMNQTIKKLLMADLNLSEYRSVKRLSDWIVSANYGSQEVIAYNIKTGSQDTFKLKNQIALSIDMNSSGSEVYILTEEIGTASESQEEIKHVVILKIKDETVIEIDQIKVFHKAKVITSLGKTQYLLLEGDQYFNLLSTNDTKLAKDIVNGLYASNRSESEVIYVGGNDQTSTKGNTNGNSPIPEENSNPNSEPQKLNEDRILSSVDIYIDQKHDLNDPRVSNEGRQITIDEKRLVQIIDDRLTIFKDELKRELIAELRLALGSELSRNSAVEGKGEFSTNKLQKQEIQEKKISPYAIVITEDKEQKE